MKYISIIVFLVLTNVLLAQKNTNYRGIDWATGQVDASTPAELAQKLVAPYKTDLEKARAMFSWIAQHIRYDYQRGRNPTKFPVRVNELPDTLSTLKSVNELVAEDVLKKRSAVCYGYSRLFKYLCDYANIPCEIINGYARGDLYKVGSNFKTNHSWNAVRIDSSWQLIDVTWASGYFTYGSDEFVAHYDDQYFLTDPGQFAQDHFPDNIEWTLLQQPPTLKEFQHSPYKSRCFSKYNITSYSPADGIIHAMLGDTIYLSVQTDLPADRRIGGGSLDDSLVWAPLAAAVYCQPVATTNNTIHYTYVADSANAQWLQLVYNDDMILRYRLDIRQHK